jgi:5,10-methylenetetrahydrofolate reductase
MAAAGEKDKAAKAEGKKGDHQVQRSIEITARLIQDLKPRCQGVHLMPLGWGHHVPAILEMVGL